MTKKLGSQNLGIEAWAEWERHFQESDALIAAWLGAHVKVATVTRCRETNFFYWQHLERRVRSSPPRTLSARALAAQLYLGEYHPADYVRPSQTNVWERDIDDICLVPKSLAPKSLMERMLPTWALWTGTGAVAAWFVGKPTVLAAAGHVLDFVKGLF